MNIISRVVDGNNYGLTFTTDFDKFMKRFNGKFEDFCREIFSGNGVQYNDVFKRSLLIG